MDRRGAAGEMAQEMLAPMAEKCLGAARAAVKQEAHALALLRAPPPPPPPASDLDYA